MFTLAGKFLHHILPGVVRPMRILWNQFIGFIFLVLAGFVALSTWRRTGTVSESPLMIVAGFGFAIFLAFFGISSLWRARRISRP
jgi:ABC-type Mn2+/Zn2+ transport system permease subunit